MAGDDIKRKGELPVRDAAGFEGAGFEEASARQGRAGGRRMRVEDVMKQPTGCREGQTVRDCAQVMMTENIGFTPICNAAGEPIGTITDRDLTIRVLAKGMSADTKVQDVMTHDVVSCRVGSDLREAEQLMRDRRKSRLMVCHDDGKLAGVISLSDVAEIEDEATAGGIVREVASRETQQPSAS